MKGRKNPLFLGIIMLALPVLPGAATAQSETSDPFKNGVGIACENKKPQYRDDHLFFLFTDNRKSGRAPIIASHSSCTGRDKLIVSSPKIRLNSADRRKTSDSSLLATTSAIISIHQQFYGSACTKGIGHIGNTRAKADSARACFSSPDSTALRTSF